MTSDQVPASLGVVVIGRNEGEQLRQCLESVSSRGLAVVYVDSGSTDASLDIARTLEGVEVIELDPAVPFTAARARNVGWRWLDRGGGGPSFVQFVDGDCVVRTGWFSAAVERLRSDPRLAVVCGRRRERRPEASVYNRMIDIEWNTPIGKTDACGGDAMMRLDALREVRGFDDSLIAGEEPDLCLRMRSRGWLVERLDCEMTLHDARLERMAQWTRRSIRSGYAYAQGASRYGLTDEMHWLRQCIRALVYGLLVPTMGISSAYRRRWRAISALAYLRSGLRAYRFARVREASPDDAIAYGIAVTLSMPAEAVGVLKFLVSRLWDRPSRIIEYR